MVCWEMGYARDKLQRWQEYEDGLNMWALGLVYVVPNVAYYFSLNLPEIFSQHGVYCWSQPCGGGSAPQYYIDLITLVSFDQYK